MFYYFFFIAHFYDERHQTEEDLPIKVKAEYIVSAFKEACEKYRSFGIKYPYKRFRSLDLEQTIPAAVIEAEDDHSVSGLLEEV